MKNPVSFKTKLWLYFVLFTAIIFSVLWLLQTVLLQTFYNQMLINNTKAAAREIISSAGSSDIANIIDEVTHDNSLLVYITDTDGNPMYISDEYKKASKTKHGNKEEQKGGQEDVPEENRAAGQKVKQEESRPETQEETGRKAATEAAGKNPGSDKRTENYRSLPENFSEYLEQLSVSENGTVEYRDENSFVYAAYINGTGGTQVLYVSALLNAVGSTAAILRIQLIIVTAFSLLIGFVLAWLIARLFSKPVQQISHKAAALGEESYSGEYRKGFCRELDELNDTLDSTSEKLKRSRSFQNELLANVSHDLRTPLTMIKGYAEEVGDYSWQDEQQRKADIGVIIRETDRLTALVNEILEYSELQAQADETDFQDVDFSTLVSRVTGNFDSLFSREGYTFQSDIESGVTVFGNASQLERVVINLLDNAVRHTGESKKVSVSMHRESSSAVLRVTDYGKGIGAEELENIWERYYTSRQRKNQGSSGLGLAIVRQIITNHSGQYAAESVIGQGSTFVIKLSGKGSK